MAELGGSGGEHGSKSSVLDAIGTRDNKAKTTPGFQLGQVCERCVRGSV